MYKYWTARAFVGICAAICVLASAFANEPNKGEWTMHRADTPGAVQLSLQNGRHMSTTSNWLKTEFTGLDFSRPSQPDVHFTLTRDAGTFNFEGVFRDESGAGEFQFSPSARYSQEMQTLGFTGVAGKEMAFAIHDVNLNFARDMKSANVQGLNADKLLAFRIHGVTPEFIKAVYAAGLNEKDSDTLIAFRIHNVTPEMIQSVRASGYTPDSKELISMRIHGATPEWMDGLKRLGYDRVPLDELVAFRIHDVSPDFIGELQQLGYKHPQPEQLVTMRIHGVTPEYIAELQARGFKDLPIEKLVTMKIHGID